MVADPQAAATKQDIQMLMEQMGIFYDRTEQRIADLKTHMTEWKEEIIHEFKVVAEDIRHDAMGAQKDKIEQHEDRITRLEKHTKLVAA